VESSTHLRFSRNRRTQCGNAAQSNWSDGGLPSRLLAELEAERREILRPAATFAPMGLDRAALRRLIEPRVVEMRSAFLGSPERARSAFRALLGDRRMRVGPDPERRFRVEGIFELALETGDARALQEHRASAITGSGGASYECRLRSRAPGCRSRGRRRPPDRPTDLPATRGGLPDRARP
jgi:hypothetical protein